MLQMYISDKFLGDVDGAGPETTLREPISYVSLYFAQSIMKLSFYLNPSLF